MKVFIKSKKTCVLDNNNVADGESYHHPMFKNIFTIIRKMMMMIVSNYDDDVDVFMITIMWECFILF